MAHMQFVKLKRKSYEWGWKKITFMYQTECLCFAAAAACVYGSEIKEKWEENSSWMPHLIAIWCLWDDLLKLREKWRKVWKNTNFPKNALSIKETKIKINPNFKVHIILNLGFEPLKSINFL